MLGFVLLILGLWVWAGVWNCSNTKDAAVIHLTAKQRVGSMNRAQQAYYLENGKFSDSLQKLGLGLQPTSEQFVYSVRATTDAAFQYGTTRPDCRLCTGSLYDWLPFLQASCHSGPCLRSVHCKSQSYAGVVYTQRIADEITTKTVLCEAKASGTVQLNLTYRNGIADCGDDAKNLAKYLE
ncbi:hypothetical protein C7B82_14370 [Stenomitos frigidus ULC18]|uniref:Uncharacterized protein n=2 Tax=Stenomitos TaxID=1844270 RepID=A0A2T1E664_9CYAN|nr:hypothetical protein C7B82_14370 [Stenomitos frigidus ULC18]